MGFRRVLALALSAMMLLTPVLSVAEGWGFSAGDLTLTTLEESYSGGYQVNVSLGFDVDTKAVSSQSETLKAAAVLLDKTNVDLSFYDDFGTARIRGVLTMDGAEIATGDMLIFEDGSMQLVTSLTGNMAFTLPAGAFESDSGMSPMENSKSAVMSAYRRMSEVTPNMVSTLINLLLGWVSSTQMETGELYTFDYETYIDATQTRDAVATRMIGKIKSTDLLRFAWGIVSHIRDGELEFMNALAYSLSDLGVTRYQVRHLADVLFPNAQIDYEALSVTPFTETKDRKWPIVYEDVYYFFCKFEQDLMNAWGENTLEEVSSMIVSYDDFGETVGLDMVFKPVSKNYPFEGDFVYSSVTDENWQRLQTAHGELQIQEHQRVFGDLAICDGEDVNGVNASYLNGQMDLVNQTTGESVGFGVNSFLNFALTPDGEGESIEANADLLLNLTGESSKLIDTDLSAVTNLTDMGLALSGKVDISVLGLPQVAANVSIVCGEYDEAPFEGGQAVNIAGGLTQEQIDEIKSVVKSNAAALGVKLALKPMVLGNLLKLAGSIAE